MLQRVFDRCYGNVKGNKNAILQRGWNPLNKGCLSNPDVLKSKTKSKPSVAVAVDTSSCVNDSHVDDMNVSNGTSRHYLQILTTSVNCDEGRERQHQAVMDDIQASQNDNASRTSLIDKMFKVRLSAGGMTRKGHLGIITNCTSNCRKQEKS
jgi:hypothetical protein